MTTVYCFQRHTRLAHLHLGNETPALAFRLQYLAATLKIGIQCGQLFPEVLYLAFKERVGQEEMLLHVILFHLVASLTGEDDQFADDVLATEVDARVGF